MRCLTVLFGQNYVTVTHWPLRGPGRTARQLVVQRTTDMVANAAVRTDSTRTLMFSMAWGRGSNSSHVCWQVHRLQPRGHAEAPDSQPAERNDQRRDDTTRTTNSAESNMRVTSKTTVYSLPLCDAPTFDDLQRPISIARACDGSAVDERAIRGAGRGSTDAAGWSRARTERCAPPSTCSIPSLRPLWTPTRDNVYLPASTAPKSCSHQSA